MARVSFTRNIQAQTPCPVCEAAGTTVREVLDAVFDLYPRARGYILDDLAGLRTHVVVFVDGVPVKDRSGLSDAVAADAEIYIMQALSGG